MSEPPDSHRSSRVLTIATVLLVGAAFLGVGAYRLATVRVAVTSVALLKTTDQTPSDEQIQAVFVAQRFVVPWNVYVVRDRRAGELRVVFMAYRTLFSDDLPVDMEDVCRQLHAELICVDCERAVAPVSDGEH
jgi:hypothetical protein